MNPAKLFFHLLWFLFIFQKTQAFEFEGNLTITRQTSFDTVQYSFTVYHNLVRIDQQNSYKHTVQSLIINLTSEKITALSPDYKLYTNIRINCPDSNTRSNLQVIQTNNYKYINGYKCFLYRVRNESMNTDMSFWVYDSGLLFFKKAIKLLSCTEDYSYIFNMFSEVNSEGGLPFLTIERTLLREEKAKIIVSQLTRKKINPDIFKIPEEYKYLRY